MADCAVQRCVSTGTAAGGWSVGVFAPAGSQMPQACMAECLKGNADLARSHGCALVRALAERTRTRIASGGPALPAPPETCDRGYLVTLAEGRSTGSPDVLILRPPGTEAAEEAIAPALDALQSAALENWRLNQESDGLASEVLRSYEQINLIFDVSAEIAILNDAEEVRRMLLTKLRHLFGADAVYYMSGDGQRIREVARDGQIRCGFPGIAPAIGPGQPHADIIALPAEFETVRSRLQESRRVLVFSEDPKKEQTGHGTSMWGPLNEGGEACAVVGIVRRDVPLIAGDMLVLDSALTYGGHILSNLLLVEQLKRTSFEAVRALVNAIDQKDNYTYGHSERVGFLAKITGQYMGLSARQLQELEWAGLLHDVGKIGIPERVLNKPGKLTDEEFALIKQHPARSFEVLRPVASLEPVLEAVLYHHENTDGSGYPRGLKGEEIPLLARIVHVVDVFDALTSTRSYRSAFDADKAISMLRQDAGTKLDAEVVDRFVGAWMLLPKTYPEQYARWFAACRRESQT